MAEHKMYCVYVSDSPIVAIEVKTKEDVIKVGKLAVGKCSIYSEVTTQY